MSKKKYYPMRVPRYATGIRSQDSRGSVARNWWAKRWFDRLLAMELGARLGRGRNYALSGQVTALDLRGAHVVASVLGAREKPYKIEINFREPTGRVRARILAKIKSEPLLLAQLLVNEMPTELELIFREEGFDFFPGGRLPAEPNDPPEKRRYDMTTTCSCPDYANPCKHATAVLVLLGEEIARRPFTLLELRGFSQKEFFDED